ncbi:MAG: hypothetical protein HOW73_22480 [Polyangiaceae bacterium]|nr:hypothetical protein [Polyangiaceae bacterium]
MTNEHSPEETDAVRDGPAAGRPASTLANELHQRGLGLIQILVVFRQATGAGIGDLKDLAQWWGADGVTDTQAFDDWAAQIFPRADR